MNIEVASRAISLNNRIMLQVLDEFVENPSEAAAMAQQIIQAADAGQLDSVIVQAVLPAIQQVMAAPPQQGS
jgi:hypothetical protein